MREVGGFIGLVDGEIDQALDSAGRRSAIRAEDAFVGFAGANQIEQEQAVEAFESGANGLHVAEGRRELPGRRAVAWRQGRRVRTLTWALRLSSSGDNLRADCSGTRR